MQTIVTHDGSFHTDDVFSVAALMLLLGEENLEIVRTRDESIIEGADWVVDVGAVYDSSRKRFDHHQPGAPVRENGIAYSAFGLLWRTYGKELCASEDVAEEIDQRLVMTIDANDNGIDTYSLREPQVVPFEIHDVVSLFKPVWGSDEDIDQQFLVAVSHAKLYLERLITKTQAKYHMREYIHEVYETAEDKQILLFDQPVSALELIQYPDVVAVIQPDNPRDITKWHAEIVRQSPDSFAPRGMFPTAWAGLRGTELQTVSGIPDAGFCHLKRFFFVAESKEGVLQAVSQIECAQ